MPKEDADAICRKGIKEGTPPPICGATSALHPHNFSHRKYSKKSACLWLENFSEIFSGECFGGKEKPPILAEIEGEVLIMNKRCDVFGYKGSGIILKCERIAVL